jgi:hypothetical protein
MNSEEVNRAANAVAVAEAELQELPLRDRTRRIQSVISAQTTLVGTTVPMTTEVKSNSTLFVSNLPNETTQEALEVLFRQFSGYLNVRLVPGREEIAFIDFDNDTGAASAKGNKSFPSPSINFLSLFSLDALNGFQISATNAIAVSFAKK